ncbi:MAG: hypothetical protein EXS05_21150 [Planctomycetaceae bacterium]|nr:hypothetical protein [Planctomycetaceae bacterium]
MPKARARKTRQVPKKSVAADSLQKAVAKLTKAELIELVIEMARGDSGIRRKLESRFQLERSGLELIQETSMAISDATDFDERQMNRNFDYDDEAYRIVQRNFGRLVNSGNLREAMALSLELMSQGSYQVEMSDEGLMSDEIEECLGVVIEALQKSNLPPKDVNAWCTQMIKKDRVGFICDNELRALQTHSNPRP